MMSSFRFLLATSLYFALVFVLHADRTLAAESVKQQVAVFEKENDFSMKYLFYLPKDYDQKESWPLLLFLHGGGEGGDDMDLLKKHGPPMLIEAGKEYPFIVVSPQNPRGKSWDAKELTAFLDEIVKKYKVDQDRIFVTGLCMGGRGTWDLAAAQPKRFAALVPICGGGDPEKTNLYADVSVWVFHGKKDNVVPIAESEQMVDALKKNGSKVKFTVYPEAAHNSWAATYNDPKLYEWLLEQKRPSETASPSPTAQGSKQQEVVMEREIKVRMKYLLYLPKDYDQKESWPLVLFLHGKGERGDDLESIKKHGPPKLIENGKEFPFIVVSPQCPNYQWWESIELKALLDDIVEKYKVDQNRIYVTGLSMGGFGAWSLAAYQPGRFAALAPICGGGDPDDTKRYAKMPIWVFHGKKDPVVPIASSEKMVEALKKIDGNVQFTIYPDAGHDSWVEAYNDPKLYQWLLEQKLPGEPVKP